MVTTSIGSYNDSINLLRSIPLKYGVDSVQISGDGNYIASNGAVCDGDNIYLFTSNSSVPLWTYSAPGSVKIISISDGGKYIVAANTGRLVGGEVQNSHYVGGGKIQDALFLLFSKENNTPLWIYELPPNVVGSLLISTNGEYIVASSSDGRLYMFNTPNSTPLWTAELGRVETLSISETGEYIAVGGDDIYLFSKGSNLPIWSAGLRRWISDVAISGDGSTLVVGAGKKIYCFSIPDGELLWEYEIGGKIKSYIDELLWKSLRILNYVSVERISLSSTGDRILVLAGGDTSFGKRGVALIFDKSNNKPIWSFQTNDYIICGDISRNGKLAAFGGSNRVYFSNGITDKPIYVFNASGTTCCHTAHNSISVSADGSYIAVGTCGENPMLYIFE